MHSTIIILSESATIAEAIKKLGESPQKILLLVDTHGKLVSVVTDSDLHRAAGNRQKFSESVKNIASVEVITLQSTQVVRDALSLFYMKDIKQSPVLYADGFPVGLLSCLDVALAKIGREK